MNTTASGRPVRFFVLLMGGWIIIRLASAAGDMLAPTGPRAPRPVTLAHHAQPAIAILPAAAAVASYRLAPPLPSHGPAPRFLAPAVKSPRRLVSTGEPGAMNAPTFTPHDESNSPPRPIATPATPLAVPLAPPGQPQPDRWRGGAWLLWREGGATPADAVAAGRLGGSQAGLRLDFDLTPRAPGRTAAYGRVSTAMNRPASPEAALGLSWQPTRNLPVSIAAERRISLGKGARDANALLVIGGFAPTPVVANLEAEAYAQAGMVGFRRQDLFADGEFSLMAPLAHSPLRLGAGISGGAQPGVERLDIGPELQLRLPLPRIATRLSVEWRERIAGRAAPASGLAITLGADF